MSAGGVAVLPPDTLLVRRALDFLAGGPATATAFVAAVCQVSGAPTLVADRLALDLLGGRPQFRRLPDGRWALAGATAPPAGDGDRLDRVSFVVVDVETTGGRPEGGDRVTEIAAVLVEGLRVVEPPLVDTLVNPERSIPSFITSITNITSAMVATAPRFRDVSAQVTDALRGRVFVAHNASFDWRFVSAEVTRATGARLQGRQLCTVRLARKLLPHLPRRSLDHVAHYYGVPNAARHRAAGDAFATAHVLVRLLRDAAERGMETWSALDTLLSAGTATSRRRRSALPRPVDRGEGA
jgi:DNA polymerase-3 subunit epsilon